MEQVAEITVKSFGNASAMPDGINIALSVASQMKDYPQTIDGLNTKVSAINAALTRAGCAEPAVTKAYRVSEVWSDKYDAAKRQFQGYKATQKLGVTIPVNNVLLGRVFEELSSSDSQPDIGITFVVRDHDALEKDARVNAVIKAKEAATDLADASGLRLMAVKSIDFTGSSCSYEADLSHLYQADRASTPEVTPDVISQEESVLMVWLASPKV
ncbi:SIMPL domain-containing protein [Rhodoferax sp.]|uniref:SIMPL domain-containing protein n=1 Tax=Rhodoferax sp. TaxID=50421 RepID=UPI00261FFCB9|nr:SIMPL domain-containing protein [Rhodoferax sp.]MDD3937981.1 SIMPL domain-containing protein [Rhodoferax sp.]